MDSKDEKTTNAESGEDQSDAKTWFNFGNRAKTESSKYAELKIPEDSIEYDMNHKNSGKCLIFNHEFYRDNICEPRKGSTADATNLYECFTKIGFDVLMRSDLDCEQLFQIVNKVAKEDHSDNDCLVCCILTHGQNESLWAHDQCYELDDILSFFKGDKCKGLAGKPKIFIIQACRGIQLDDGVQMKVPTDVTDGRGTKMVTIPVYADYLIAYSSMSGFYSWRNVTDGSWFISNLTEVVNKYHKHIDFLSMLTIVNQKIAYNSASKSKIPDFNDKKQVPCITHTLTRKMFFPSKDTSSRSTYL